MRKRAYLAIMLLNIAADILLPALVLVALTPTGLPTAVRLAIGGTLLTGKAVAGRVETGVFRWRFGILVAALATTAIVGCYLAGFGAVPSMVAGAITSGVLVIGDLLLDRSRPTLDGFALLVLVEVALGVVLTSISGDARFVLARTSLYMAVGGVYMLVSAFTTNPLMRTALKPVAANGDPARAEAFDRTWEKSRQFRAIYRGLTAGFGVVLLIDAVLRIVIIYGQPADAVTKTSFTSQIPLIVMVALWFVIGRGLVVPRARRILDAEMEVSSR
ncbi:VC0807 family protein [Fodinicola acaciae]|uniref:VC0807 family protein n=1 Tax=Fodinicola acaciae TaxID=2681555 RepID=UPI0013D6A23F|nr:VC0807 family protein [Fodinicola acaciae]